jgi:membrane-associated protease RseP (regulator of RpoE activity)
LIFIAGPMFSFVFAASLIGAIVVTNGWPPSHEALMARHDLAVGLSIALFSVAIGLFNLLPLWPLDGGHLTLIALDACGRPAGVRMRERYAAGSLWVLRLGSAALAAALVWFAVKSWS